MTINEKNIDNLPKIVIYGTNLQAAALYKMIRVEQQAEVEAFIVDRNYRKCNTFEGLEVVDFENIEYLFPKDKYKICLSFGYKNMMYNRKEKFSICKEMGYELYTFVSKNAMIYTDKIGEGSNIYPGTILAPFSEIGKGSFIECGCVIAHHTKIGEYNFVAPGVHFCGAVVTGHNCFIGSAAEIINGCRLGNDVFIAASAKVSRDIDNKGVVLPSEKHRKIEKKSFEMMEYMFEKSNERNKKFE